ncbi:hypothetical protein FND99_00190 [Flavobacterium daemonense]|nr:hypothetical protein FND99_00190 [Flavobacterium daemonense]
MEKLEIERLKKSLHYLKSKQRELKRHDENEIRSFESIIKYQKNYMVEQYKLLYYEPSIKQEIKNTEIFIGNVQKIIDQYS